MTHRKSLGKVIAVLASALFLLGVFLPLAEASTNQPNANPEITAIDIQTSTENTTLGTGEAAGVSSPLKGMDCSTPTSDCNRSVENVPASFSAIVTENGPDHGGFLFGLGNAPDPNVFFHWQSFNRLNHPKGTYIVTTESREEENEAGRPKFNELKTQEAGHPVEEVGRQLRKMMPWMKE